MASTSPKADLATHCATCEDTSWVVGKDGAGPCRCRRQRRIKYSLEKIPASWGDISLKSSKDTNVLTLKKGWDSPINQTFPKDFNSRESYFLYGALGIGKTHFMWCQYRELADIRVCQYRESALLIELQERAYGGTRGFVFDDDSHFFIDELGSSKYTEDREMLMLDFIDNIYSSDCGVTITSNLSLIEMEKTEALGAYTERVTRRIGALCNVVKMGS